ncbi:MAG: hypothetical protein M3R38_20950 [Actinomycetota bacterium]|nr:hypothetical protein [Actinomycetota bacterium]
MRVATTILSLALMLVVGAQSCVVTVGSALAEDEAATNDASIGLLVAFLFLVGGAFAFGLPLVSLIVFVVAGLLGLLVGTTSEFTDLAVWGVASFVLAGLSFFGMREKRRRSQAPRVE